MAELNKLVGNKQGTLNSFIQDIVLLEGVIMKYTKVKKESFLGNSPFTAYLFAVSASAFSFTLFVTIFTVFKGGFESATENSFGTEVSHLTVIMLLQFLSGWIFALIVSIIPFIMGLFIIKKFKTTKIAFFISGGITVGILASPLFALIPSLGINVQGFEPFFMQKNYVH